jgi:hypothetical protein
VNLIFEILEKADIRINKFKYIFHAKEVEFLDYIMGSDRIKMDLKKSINNLGLASITKRNRDLKVYEIREFLSTIY